MSRIDAVPVCPVCYRAMRRKADPLTGHEYFLCPMCGHIERNDGEAGDEEG